jgi:cbb3-type cytochrome oxidase maturation protein
VTIGLGVFALAVWAMFWAIDSGQYDDAERHGRSILDED